MTGACVGANVDPFDPLRIHDTLALCRRCPIVAECAELGRGEYFGVWGGIVKTGTLGERGHLMRKEIVEMVRDGDSTETIVDVLTVGYPAVRRVRNYLTRSGRRGNMIAGPTVGPELMRQSREMADAYANSDLPLKAIAHQFGVSAETVRRALMRTGTEPRPASHRRSGPRRVAS